MNEPFYGRCDTCSAKLSNRYHAFSRHVEKLHYGTAEITGSSAVHVDILFAEQLTQYCSAVCAEVGAYCQLNDRGIPLDIVGQGPIAACSKCGKPMDLRIAHVAYELIEQTEIRKPWLTTVEPHDSETVARVCSCCDPNLIGHLEMDLVDEVEKTEAVSLLEMLR